MSEHIVPVFKVQREVLFSCFESLWRIFESIVWDPRIDSVFCVLNGLDEHSLEMLTKKLKGFFSKAPTGPLKLIVISRELSDSIPRAMSSFPHISLDLDSGHEIDSDLRQFITFKINSLSLERSYSEDLRISIEATLLGRAKGTFLLVSFVIEELKNKMCVEAEDTLNCLPIGLEGMYERILLQIPKERWNIAALILRWVVIAVRPLTLTELGVVIGVKPTRALTIDKAIREYVGFCGYFLMVIGNIVYLIHQSAKDYLLRKDPNPNPQLELFYVKEKETNAEIARTCLTYLSSGALIGGQVQLIKRNGKAVDISHLQAFPLLRYAILHWPEHAQQSSSLARDIFNLSTPFFKEKSPIREAWLKAYFDNAPSSFSLLHLASYFGIVLLI
jgi:hypothetical protein